MAEVCVSGSLREAYETARAVSVALGRMGAEGSPESAAAAAMRRGLSPRDAVYEPPDVRHLRDGSALRTCVQSGRASSPRPDIARLRSEVMASLGACVIVLHRWSEAHVHTEKALAAAVTASQVLYAAWGALPGSTADAVPIDGGLRRWCLL